MTDELRRAEEAELLAHNLLLFAAELRTGAAGAGPAPGDRSPEYRPFPDPSDSMLAAAQRVYRSRRRRADYFPDDLLGEPAWDMLVDLYIAFVNNRDISVKSACLASNVPSTTGLRWLAILEERGLVERERAAHDRRVQFVRITRVALRSMRRYLLEIEKVHTRPAGVFMLAGG